LSNTWDFLKPLTTVDSAGADMGSPQGRYGHSAVLVVIDANKDPNQLKRQFMYVFGGMGKGCLNGLCSDMWKYEIPWAAQAYWPGTDPANWQKGETSIESSGEDQKLHSERV
jgi:hypothetical protein